MIRPDAGGEYLTYTGGNPTGASTMCGWFARDGAGNGTFEGIFRWGGATADLTNADALYYQIGTPNRFEIWAGDNSAARGSYTITLNTGDLHFAALVDEGGASGSNITLYHGTERVPAVSRIAVTRGTNALTSTRVFIGEGWNFSGADWFNGGFFNVQMYDRALTLEEVIMVQMTMMPPAPYRPWGHWRCWRVGDYEDISGNGRDVAPQAGTPIDRTPNPAIQLGSWMPRFSRASGGGAGPVGNLAWITA